MDNLSPSLAHSRSAQSGIQSFRAKAVAFLTAGVVMTSLVGCVERRMTIRTNVDHQGGALVYLDNEEVGTTPVSTGFTYYADREIKLVKDGYESVTLIQPICAPWWDSLLLEFFTENLWPFTLRDERQFHYELSPSVIVSSDEVVHRGERLRNEAQQGAEIVPGVRPGVGAAAPLGF